MDLVFKALADPTRRKILKILANGERTAGSICEQFSISAPSMSHHFSILKQADLIIARRDGQQIFYAINTTVFQDVTAALFDLFGAKLIDTANRTREAAESPKLPEDSVHHTAGDEE
jgi:ArsR family transcriptional regulator, arsenate/arsenite/antimonite-responsive transcriptional repressor